MFSRTSDKRSDSIGQFDPGTALLGQFGALRYCSVFYSRYSIYLSKIKQKVETKFLHVSKHEEDS